MKNYFRQVSQTDDIRSCASRPKVSMIAWSCDDEYIVTAVTDLCIKVWNSHTGKLVHCLKVGRGVDLIS